MPRQGMDAAARESIGVRAFPERSTGDCWSTQKADLAQKGLTIKTQASTQFTLTPTRAKEARSQALGILSDAEYFNHDLSTLDSPGGD